jgi:hypothetical protein
MEKEATRFPRLPPPTRVLRDEDSQMADDTNASSNSSSNSSSDTSTNNASTTVSTNYINYINPPTLVPASELSTPVRPLSSAPSRALLDTVMETAEQLSATNLHTPSQNHTAAHNFTQNSNILSDTSLSQTNLSHNSQTNIINTTQSNTNTYQR